MFIHLFRDKSSTDIFAFSTDPQGRNLPSATPGTGWIFMESIDTLRFPDPWDIADFQGVLDQLKADGYYMFQGALIEPATSGKPKPANFARH